jgi:hypothetical protein
MAFVALLAAVSGTAVALPGKNTVDSGDIRKGAVKRADIGRNAVNGGKVSNGSLTGADARDDSLTGADVQESSLGQVPSANTANSANSATTAGNADRLDNLDSGDFLPAQSSGVALAGANVTSTGTLNSWFNRFGGEPTVTRTEEGRYELVFPGLESQLLNSQAIHMATLLGAGQIRASSVGGDPLVVTMDSAGTAADNTFYYTVFGSNLTP